MRESQLKFLKDRDRSFDIAKGIAIFLMVIGHTSIPKFANIWIYSFHMPLFFFVSGVFFNPKKYSESRVFFITKSKTLLIPYILYLLVSEFLKLICNIGNVTLWFLPVLFVTEILFYSIVKLIERVKWKSLLIVTLITLLAISSYTMSLFEIIIPFDLQNVGHSLIYYSLGYYLSSWIKRISMALWKIFLLIVVYTIVVLLLPKLDMLPNHWGIMPLNQILAVAGTILIILGARVMSSWNEKNLIFNFFNWAGRNSIILVGFSIPFITLCNEVGVFFIEDTHAIWFSLGKHVAMWITMYYLSVFFLKYAPWAIGKYTIDKL